MALIFFQILKDLEEIIEQPITYRHLTPRLEPSTNIFSQRKLLQEDHISKKKSDPGNLVKQKGWLEYNDIEDAYVNDDGDDDTDDDDDNDDEIDDDYDDIDDEDYDDVERKNIKVKFLHEVPPATKTKVRRSLDDYTEADLPIEEPLALPSLSRSKRYLNEHEVNVTLIEYLDTGRWYISIYNDALGYNKVSIIYQNCALCDLFS